MGFNGPPYGPEERGFDAGRPAHGDGPEIRFPAGIRITTLATNRTPRLFRGAHRDE
ncbi:hypothetical protein GCM10010433_56880 [Streptomyces pulveraceus]